MGKRHYIAAGLLALTAALISRFPASWAAQLAAPDVNASYGGTIWDGHIRGLNGLPPVAFRLSPKAALTQDPLLTFWGHGNGISINGTASHAAIQSLSLTGQASFLTQMDSRLLGLSGDFSVTAKHIGFDASCEADTAGTLITDILANNTQRLGWTGPHLTGPLRCEGGDLTASLSGNSPGQALEATLKVITNGTFQIRAIVNSNHPKAALVLPLYGLEQRGERFTMTEAGKWR